MSTGWTWQTSSTNSEDTELLGQKLGQALKGGEVIELVSDLGGGKTTFTRGLARGARSDNKVTSPTFTISKIYDAPTFEIHHFDFYRLHEAGIIGEELAEVLNDPHVVVVVEWADVVQHVLPPKRVTVLIEQTASGSRRITFRGPASLDYIMRAVG
jgi:tRNA threonylcarbamoyladenosine biosynthesis protein TsaE